MREHVFYSSKFVKWFYVPLILGTVLGHLTLGIFSLAENKAQNNWAITLLFIGFALFMKAKLSILSKDRLVTFAASAYEPMTTEMRLHYIGGYCLMISGICLQIF